MAAATLVEVRDDAPGHDRRSGGPRDLELLGEHVVGLGEGALYIPGRVLQVRNVVRAQRLVEQWRVRLQRLLRIQHDGQPVPGHVDEIPSVLGQVGTRRHHHRNRLSDIARLVRRQRMPLRRKDVVTLDQVGDETAEDR